MVNLYLTFPEFMVYEVSIIDGNKEIVTVPAFTQTKKSIDAHLESWGYKKGTKYRIREI